jgi:hypothetical protein
MVSSKAKTLCEAMRVGKQEPWLGFELAAVIPGTREEEGCGSLLLRM